jgi:hypothetical protein
MKNSTLYRIHPREKYLQAVKEIEFSDFQFRERYDIQEWVESTPEILGEKLLIVSKELSSFTDTKERLDLLALDKSGNTVIVELKRDDSGLNMEWQAIKYASYLSKFTPEEIIDRYSRYLSKVDGTQEIDTTTAEQQILEFVEQESAEELNRKQRIILVSHRFAKEVTSAVNWLITNNRMDIRCVQLIPYFDQDKDTYYIESQLILPLPGEDDLAIRAAGGRSTGENRQSGPVRKDDEFTEFLDKARQLINDRIGRDFIPTKWSRWAGVGATYRYYHLWYSKEFWDNWYCSYKMWIFNDKERHAERRNKIGLFLDIGKKHMLNYGIPETKLNELIAAFEKADLGGKLIKAEGDFIRIEAYTETNSLNDGTMQEAVEKMIKIIACTMPLINQILTI